MKRRLNLAAAIVHEPPLVLLDEPTVGVDPQSRSAIFDLVRGMRERGRTVVYTTHYMEEAQRLCDRVGIIDRGRLLALDTVDGLIRAYGGNSVVVVERDGESEERIETAEPVGVVARELAGGGATGLRIERPDLEGVFLRLTGRTLRD
jgi:ABC-2 type transport system ATP-binding protein